MGILSCNTWDTFNYDEQVKKLICKKICTFFGRQTNLKNKKYVASVLKQKKRNSLKVEKYETKVVGNGTSNKFLVYFDET